MAVFVRRQPETTGTGGKGTVKLKVLERRVLFPSILILFVGVAASGIMSFFSLYAIEKGFQSVGMFFFLIAGASFLYALFPAGYLTVTELPPSLFPPRCFQ